MATTRPATAGQRHAPTDRRRGLRPDRPRPPLEPRHHPIPAPLARALFPRFPLPGLFPSAEARPPLEPRQARAPTSSGPLRPSRHPHRPRLKHLHPPRHFSAPPRHLRPAPHARTPRPRHGLARGERATPDASAASPSSNARPVVAAPPSTEAPSPRPPPSALAPFPTRDAARRPGSPAPQRGGPSSSHPRPSTPPPPTSSPRRAPHVPTLAASRCPSRRNRSRAAISARRRHLRFTGAAPPLLSTTGNEVKGERTPVDGNTSPGPVGFKTGHHAAGAAPPFPPRAPSPSACPRKKKKRFRERRTNARAVTNPVAEDEPVHPVPKTACRR
ncbi:hypothetical protein U9M48_002955 [Paspalum notatum var. saurae]|uniref:Uncharacterized protein n=1 Tax=Paspalum notatum var. saurae TaxID=547442 RepID=A0AAQ3PIH3_PASNO